jgi:hypothetical protein
MRNCVGLFFFYGVNYLFRVSQANLSAKSVININFRNGSFKTVNWMCTIAQERSTDLGIRNKIRIVSIMKGAWRKLCKCHPDRIDDGR